MTGNARGAYRRIAWFGMTGLLALALIGGSGVGHAQDDGATLKQTAIDKIREYGPAFLQAAQNHYFSNKGAQLAWLRDVLLCIIPLLALFGVTLYPILRSQSIRARLPNPPMGRLFKLYATQGAILMVILFVLGFCLFLLQFWMATLGELTNPQLILQEQAIEYVVDNSEELVNNYTAVFSGVAERMNGDPSVSMLSIILANGQSLRDDPLIRSVVWFLELIWPLLSNLFLITFLVIAASFLRRLWPDIRRMMRFPLDLIAAERGGTGFALGRGGAPAFAGLPGVAPPGYGPPAYPPSGYGPPGASGAAPPPAGAYPPPPPRSVSSQMWAEGRRLIWLEIRVVGVFLVAATILAVLMGMLLYVFLIPLIGLLINTFSVAMLYFVSYDGAASAIALVVVLIGVFLVECFVLFGAIFFLLIRKTLGVFRRRFTSEITWRETWRLIGRQSGRFGLVAGLTALLGIVVIMLADWTGGFLIGSELFALGLLAVPIILLVGFNLGFWFGRGVKIMRAMW